MGTTQHTPLQELVSQTSLPIWRLNEQICKGLQAATEHTGSSCQRLCSCAAHAGIPWCASTQPGLQHDVCMSNGMGG